ncbi:hypothetical protein [Halopseudomonas salegens]|uniref:Uncharacterized protein n=1 Tax=Halopseudomonas salegens TaxID=1434072 RepID=A0A1H2HXT4_9GAMM|nr:hypothetical protein [Halopseudomonas salegens]SDU36358.1 hypothetical protein SAMN05216210_3376 [Halopseudomonas salegens]
MAPAHYIVGCTACDLQRSYSSSAPDCAYQTLDGQQLPMPASPGWCSDCRNLCRVERLPSAEGEAALLKTLLCLRLDFANLLKDVPQKLPWWQFYAKPMNGIDTLEADISQLEQQLEAYRVLRAALAERASPGRCLTCGGSNHQPLPLPTRPDQPDVLNVNHPGCGGQLTIQASKQRPQKTGQKQLFDLEGRQIHSP